MHPAEENSLLYVHFVHKVNLIWKIVERTSRKMYRNV